MTASHRLIDYLNHMLEAARQACLYVETMNKADFLSDRRTQQAVILNLLILGEAVTKLLSQHEAFAARYPQVPWRSMKGMRNRLAHGYFDINLDVVWDTAQTALPDLLAQLPAIRDAVMADNPNSSGQ
ncbi:MAG: DUF86 domain-containing protein [Polaromonas sp.]